MTTMLQQREQRLEEHTTAAARSATARWQPSFFDRRLARALEAIRSDRDRRLEAHAARALELTASDDGALEVVLAIVSRP